MPLQPMDSRGYGIFYDQLALMGKDWLGQPEFFAVRRSNGSRLSR